MAMTSAVLTSCLSSEDPYNAGFVMQKPQNSVSYYYANNTGDSLVFYGLGNWVIGDYPSYDNSWISVPVKKGYGNQVYAQKVTFEQNTTGASRVACIQIKDVNHPDKANYAVAYAQYATRGTGTLGSAADVKRIEGSDGSLIELSYDVLHRPLSVSVKKSDVQLAHLALSYDDGENRMSITDAKSGSFSASYDWDYQPWYLANKTDTIGYFYRYYDNGMPVATSLAFNFEHRQTNNKRCISYVFSGDGAQFHPDSLHQASQLLYYTNGTMMHSLDVTYSSADNRCQSVDVNQLLLGVEACDPYLLASLFRYARNSHIIAEAKGEHETIQVTTQLNADRSVNSMVVQHGSTAITYTFYY